MWAQLTKGDHSSRDQGYVLAFLQIKRFLMIEMFDESWMKTDAIEKNLLFKHQRKDETV